VGSDITNKNNGPVGYRMHLQTDITCLQDVDTTMWWVNGWLQLIMSYEQAEVKPSQNFPLYSRTMLKPYKTQQQ